MDRSVIALWPGHESVETTQIYLHADLRLKEKALSRMAVPAANPGRYRPDDKRLAFPGSTLNMPTWHAWLSSGGPALPAEAIPALLSR